MNDEAAPPPDAAVFECGDCHFDITPLYTTQADLHVPLAWVHVATRRPECYPTKVAHPVGDLAAAVAAVTLDPTYWQRHDDWPTMPPIEHPGVRAQRTTDDLWNRCYVAENEEEAYRQAARQFADFEGKLIVVHSITGRSAEDADYGEYDFGPHDRFLARVVGSYDTDGGWDGDVLYPDWKLRPVDPDAKVVPRDLDELRLADLIEWWYVAPGVGSREGFGEKDESVIIEPEPVS